MIDKPEEIKEEIKEEPKEEEKPDRSENINARLRRLSEMRSSMKLSPSHFDILQPLMSEDIDIDDILDQILDVIEQLTDTEDEDSIDGDEVKGSMSVDDSAEELSRLAKKMSKEEGIPLAIAFTKASSKYKTLARKIANAQLSSGDNNRQ